MSPAQAEIGIPYKTIQNVYFRTTLGESAVRKREKFQHNLKVKLKKNETNAASNVNLYFHMYIQWLSLKS